MNYMQGTVIKPVKMYLDVLREVFLEFFFIFFFKRVHVFSDVETHDVFLVNFSVEFTFGKSWESFWRVWNVQTSISSTLQDTEDTGTSWGSGKTSIQVASEWWLKLDIRLVNRKQYFQKKLETLQSNYDKGVPSWRSSKVHNAPGTNKDPTNNYHPQGSIKNTNSDIIILPFLGHQLLHSIRHHQLRVDLHRVSPIRIFEGYDGRWGDR